MDVFRILKPIILKERILTGWTFTRAFYLLAGSAMLVFSFLDKQWFGVAIGTYFAAMGLFAFGCAAGNCFGGNCTVDPEKETSNNKL